MEERISNGVHFGQFRKVGRAWQAEIRKSTTGNLVRFAGIWKTRKDAVKVIEWYLSKPEYN